MMKILLLAIALLVCNCAVNPSRLNTHPDFAVTIESQKDHSEGLDITLTLSNSSRQTMRLFSRGAATLVLDGKL